MMFNGNGDMTMQLNPDMVDETLDADSDVDLLDLYVCCQCSCYVIVSDTLPGVIPAKYIEEFNAERSRYPMPGKTAEISVVVGWETILKCALSQVSFLLRWLTI
jgi:ubiquitin carboxyl-terminal hydrolase 25/28